MMIDQLYSWETLAASLGIAYILLAARESQWCWPAAFISTLIYTVLFWEGRLPMQALLNFYYMGMAGYGFWLWHHGNQVAGAVVIHEWPWRNHLIYLSVGLLLTLVIGYVLAQHYQTQYPYLDAGITVFAMLNTWLMARKVIQNWLYWQVINSASIVLYLLTGYLATVLMFSIYLLLSFHGYVSWKKRIRLQLS